MRKAGIGSALGTGDASAEDRSVLQEPWIGLPMEMSVFSRYSNVHRCLLQVGENNPQHFSLVPRRSPHSSCPHPPGWQDLQHCLQHAACSVLDTLRHICLPYGCHHRFLGAPQAATVGGHQCPWVNCEGGHTPPRCSADAEAQLF